MHNLRLLLAVAVVTKVDREAPTKSTEVRRQPVCGSNQREPTAKVKSLSAIPDIAHGIGEREKEEEIKNQQNSQ